MQFLSSYSSASLAGTFSCRQVVANDRSELQLEQSLEQANFSDTKILKFINAVKQGRMVLRLKLSKASIDEPLNKYLH
jgi:hypothetical protein